MPVYTIQLRDDEQYRLLIQLAHQASITALPLTEVEPPAPTFDMKQMTRDEYLEIIRRGGDGKSIRDPLAWQREQREDRDLPFHILNLKPEE